MEHANPNPIIIGLLFILRCVVPLVILFGISYLLRRLGWLDSSSQNGSQEKHP